MSPLNNTDTPNVKEEELSLWSIFKFFLPLGATPFMIGLTHSIINAALARLPLPDLSIAIFTVTKGIIGIISVPTLISLQLVLTFVDNMESFQKTMRFILVSSFSLLSILFIIAYTPLGEWVLKTFFNLKDREQIEFAYLALRIGCFLPLVQLFRNSHQGLAVGLRQTKLLIPGIAIRLLSISIFLYWTVKTKMMLGITAGTTAWIAGIGIEGIFIFLILIYSYGSIKETINQLPKKNDQPLTYLELLKFFIPLGLMMSLGSSLQPFIQGGIARGPLATQALAAYGVSWSIVALLAGPLNSLHQLSIVFINQKDDPDWKNIQLFSFGIGLFITIIVLIFSLTPLGNLLFHQIIGVSKEISSISQKVMLSFALYPIIRSLREAYWGLLMKKRTTNMIAIAKTSNLLTVIIFLLISFSLTTVHPAVLGGLSFTIGELIETLFIWYFTNNYNRQQSEGLKVP